VTPAAAAAAAVNQRFPVGSVLPLPAGAASRWQASNLVVTGRARVLGGGVVVSARSADRRATCAAARRSRGSSAGLWPLTLEDVRAVTGAAS